MAYYSGAASDLSGLRSALVNACVFEGWAWDGGSEVLSKGDLFLKLQVTAESLTLLGRTSAAAGDAPNIVRIGQLFNSPTGPTYQFSWPTAWELFVFTDPDEVYLVVNYDVDRYQWCAFGQSSVQGLPGTGMWFGATIGPAIIFDGNYNYDPFYIASESGGYDSTYGVVGTSGALAYNTCRSYRSTASANFWLHSDLDAQGWLLNEKGSTYEPIGIRYLTELLKTQPNTWNSEAVLLPLRAFKVRPENRTSLTMDLQNARHLRIDNYAAGEVITLGSDQWKVFPWHRKHIESRDGDSYRGIDHTGTFGWAIRYEGP